MVPIHDSDLAEERWTKASWSNFELWEKVEIREKRKRQIWIFATFFLFFILSAIPVAVDQWPKWTTQHLVGKLAREINQMKRDASIARTAYRLRFVEDGKLKYEIEKLKSCSDTRGDLVRSVSLDSEYLTDKSYTLILPHRASSLEIPGLISQVCFDPLSGSSVIGHPDKNMAGFGIISVNDLTEKRLDRMSILLISGLSAEINFE